MKNTQDKHRYQLVADYHEISVNKMCLAIDVNPTTIGNAIRRNSAVTPEIAGKIVAKYPDISFEWLITGKGDMLADATSIKAKRKRYNLSQNELADATGIPRDRLAKWEQGIANPKTEDTRKLDAFFARKQREQDAIDALNEPDAGYTIAGNVFERLKANTADLMIKLFSPRNLKNVTAEHTEAMADLQRAIEKLEQLDSENEPEK